MHSKNDIDMLTNVRKYLVDISRRVYRDYKFFFQAENREQRREIYNRSVSIGDSSCYYPVVCKSFCEVICKNLISLYGYDVRVISCDSDEFGHCDILVCGDQKYIINCLSDLELNQLGMRSNRFASIDYCKERYPQLLCDDGFGFLDFDELKEIDKSIGYYNGMYFDDVIERLAIELSDFKKYLIDDDAFRKILICDASIDDVYNLSTLEILKIKFKFLCNYFNGRENIIGHIELIRVYKLLMKRFFSKEELKYIKWNNCFFDRKDNIEYLSIFNTNNSRVRFISFEIDDVVYLVSTVGNNYICMSNSEWNDFKYSNNVVVNSINGSKDSISEYLRNKGIGVNIMKHSVVKKMLNDIEDCIFCNKSDSYKKKVLDDIYNQGNKIVLVDDYNNCYCIFLDNYFIKITINDDSYIYYYIDDNMNMSNYDERIIYKWKDECAYEEHVFRKNNIKKQA